MNRLFFFPLLLAVLLVPAACTQKQVFIPTLTEIQVLPGEEPDCGAVFPGGNWQLVHSIEFTLKNGGGSTLVGVTALTSDRLDCALLTPEGFTLFSGSLDREGGFKVDRAVAPFDKPAFARGMMEDLRAIFREPPGEKRYGRLRGQPDAGSVCRHRDAEGKVTDVLQGMTSCWEIHTYMPNKILSRSVIAQSCQKIGPARIPQYLELRTYGPTGYTLKMTLLTVEYFQ